MPARPIDNGGVISPVDRNNYLLTAPCSITGKSHSVTLPALGLFHYRMGRPIETCFPAMSLDDREFLISGTSPEGWRMIFPNGGDD